MGVVDIKIWMLVRKEPAGIIKNLDSSSICGELERLAGAGIGGGGGGVPSAYLSCQQRLDPGPRQITTSK